MWFECKTGKFPLGSDMTFTDGHFYDSTSGMGSKFIPVDKPNLNPFEKFINDNLRIQWCPTEKYFVVMVQGAPYELRSAGPPATSGRPSLKTTTSQRVSRKYRQSVTAMRLRMTSLFALGK